MTLENLVLIIGGTLTGLCAGVYYAFNVAFVSALRQLKPKEHIEAMKWINIKIQNPVFFLSFFGPTLLLPLAAFLYRNSSQFLLLVVASILQVVGSNGVTIGGNLPLNEKLDKVAVSQLTEAEAETIRNEYQGKGSAWIRFHNIRTIATIAATALVFVACLSKD